MAFKVERGMYGDTEEQRAQMFADFVEGGTALDGHKLVGVATTGIYCRSTCRVQSPPKPSNCSYFASAALAEAAQYRPCLMCRPELMPGIKNVGADYAQADRAAGVLRAQYSWPGDAACVLERFGFDVQTLAAEFSAAYGVSLDAFLQTQRLLGAKALLTDSRIPVAQVAPSCGFADEDALVACMQQAYRFAPNDLRRRRLSKATLALPGVAFKLDYRAPYEFDKLLGFFRYRTLVGVEVVDDVSYARTVRVTAPNGEELLGWVRVENDAAHNRLACRMSTSLLPVYSQVVARVRHTFDVDCDPEAVHEGLATLDTAVAGANVCGTRVPGAFDAFEITVRAILGQQVSVLAANKMAERIAQQYGVAFDAGIEGLTCAFPTAADFAAMEDIEGALGVLGVIKTRSRTIQELARKVGAGEIDFSTWAVPAEQMKRLLAVKGIGPWSANYICMRTLGFTDAFLEKDAGIKHALPQLEPEERLAAAEAWRPWRSYANVALWNSLS